MSEEPQMRFTGVFIPVEILDNPDLSFFEMILLSFIDALYDEEFGGCFASNEEIAEVLLNRVTKYTVAKGITRLRELGFIINVPHNLKIPRLIRISHQKIRETKWEV